MTRLRSFHSVARSQPSWTELRNAPILKVAEALGIKVSRAGHGRCPFPDHPDHTPSFVISRARNDCRCFGCGRGGSPIDLVAHMRGIDLKSAAGWLAEWQSTPSVVAMPLRAKVKQQSEPSLRADPEVYSWLLEACPLSARSLDYLNGRGITEATARHFHLAELGDEACASALMRRWGRRRLQEAGVLRGLSALAFDSPALLFPFMDASEVVYLQARYIGTNPTRSRWMGLRAVRQPTYNLEAVARTRDIYICEGAMDVISAHELGLTAIGILGGHARLSADVVGRLANKTVYIIPDGDKTGDAMSERLRRQLTTAGIDNKIQHLPAGKDLNEYLVWKRSRGK